MPFIQTEPRNLAEQAVRDAGYRWFQTNTLCAYDAVAQPDFDENRIDRLNQHVHGSPNTHVIQEGELRLVRDEPGSTVLARGLTISTDRDAAAREVTISAGTYYRGEAGPFGCKFTEGHTILSPKTAQRFCERGTIYWCDANGPEASENGRVLAKEEQQRRWFDDERERGSRQGPPKPVSMRAAGLLRRDGRNYTLALEDF